MTRVHRDELQKLFAAARQKHRELTQKNEYHNGPYNQEVADRFRRACVLPLLEAVGVHEETEEGVLEYLRDHTYTPTITFDVTDKTGVLTIGFENSIGIQTPMTPHVFKVPEEAIEPVRKVLMAGEVGSMAAILHDVGHSGSDQRAEDHVNILMACMLADEIVRDALVGYQQFSSSKEALFLRQQVQLGIMATNFHGQNLPLDALGGLARLLRIADVADFEKSFEEWILESLRVMVELNTIPQDAEAFLRTRQGFIGYLETLVGSSPHAQKLWGEKLDEMSVRVNGLLNMDGHDVGVVILNEFMAAEDKMRYIRKKEGGLGSV